MRFTPFAAATLAVAASLCGACSGLQQSMARSQTGWRGLKAGGQAGSGCDIKGNMVGFLPVLGRKSNLHQFLRFGTYGGLSQSCSGIHGRSLAAKTNLSTRRSKRGQGGLAGASMGIISRFIMYADSTFGHNLSRVIGGQAGLVSIVITLLPDILNLAVVVVLLYAAMISCAPIYNELLWTLDESDAPPIEGRKWEDFDKATQDILRSYKAGDVKPTGTHIEEWNRQVKRRKMRLENAVQAARRYKRALEAERRRSNVVKSAATGDRGVGFFKKIFTKLGPTKTGLFKTAERAKEEYMKAKADYMQEGTYSASFIRPKRYGTETLVRGQTALEQADEKNQEAELQAMMVKLKEMKDQPIVGEIVDTTSQFGARSLEDLVSAEQAFTRLWPKAVAPDGIHRVISQSEMERDSESENKQLSLVSKEARLRGEKLPSGALQPVQKESEKTYSVFGSQRTVRLPKGGSKEEQKRKRLGIPVMFVVVPTVSLTAFLYYHTFTTAIALLSALLSASLYQTWRPVHIFSAISGAKFLRWYASLLGGIASLGSLMACLEAVILTMVDILFGFFATIFSQILIFAVKGASSCSDATILPAWKWIAKLSSIVLPLLPQDSSLDTTQLKQLQARAALQERVPAFVYLVPDVDRGWMKRGSDGEHLVVISKCMSGVSTYL